MQRYLMGHWDGCSCDACRQTFAAHNPDSSGPICSCTGCQGRKKGLQTKPVVSQKTPDHRATIAMNAQYGKQGRTKVATVNFCERCNTMGKSVAMGTVEIQRFPYETAEPVEICPGCVQDMVDFMAGKPVGALKDQERPKSYSEPWTETLIDPLAKLSDDELARAYLARVAAQEGVKELQSGVQDE